MGEHREDRTWLIDRRRALALAGALATTGLPLGSLARAAESAGTKADESGSHIEFAPITHNLMTPANWFLLALIAFGGISLIARFALGLGGSTHLSNTYAWGLWIVFDLVWIAIAAGAFATAGLIYVFQRKDLYSMEIGRAHV